MRHERDIKPIGSDIAVCRRLMEVRLAWKLTLTELAARLDVQPTTLRSWELGRSVPSFEGLIRWADVLGFEISIWPKKT